MADQHIGGDGRRIGDVGGRPRPSTWQELDAVGCVGAGEPPHPQTVADAASTWNEALGLSALDRAAGKPTGMLLKVA